MLNLLRNKNLFQNKFLIRKLTSCNENVIKNKLEKNNNYKKF